VPLSTRPSPVEVYDGEVALLINHMLEQANRAMRSAVPASKLLFCMDLAIQHRRDKGGDPQKYCDAEAYFRARIGTINEPGIYSAEHVPERISDRSFERTRLSARDMPTNLRHTSADRLAKRLRHDREQPVLDPYGNSLRWAAKGAADRLHDDNLAGAELRPHKPPTRRTMSVFPLTLVD
jgi:hypothetical protein